MVWACCSTPDQWYLPPLSADTPAAIRQATQPKVKAESRALANGPLIRSGKKPRPVGWPAGLR